MKEQLVTDARRVLKEEKAWLFKQKLQNLLLDHKLCMSTTNLWDHNDFVSRCSRCLCMLFVVLCGHRSFLHRFFSSFCQDAAKKMLKDAIASRDPQSLRSAGTESVTLAKQRDPWVRGRLRWLWNVRYRSAILQWFASVSTFQHDLASFDIQSFGRTAIAKGEALRLKDAELEEARRVLEEEKVGSLMWCAAVAFPCHYKAARCCKYINANTVKWKQSLKIVETWRNNSLPCNSSEASGDRSSFSCSLFYILAEDCNRHFGFPIPLQGVNAANHKHDKHVLGLYPHNNLSDGGRSISGIGTFGHLNQASVSAMAAHIRTQPRWSPHWVFLITQNSSRIHAYSWFSWTVSQLGVFQMKRTGSPLLTDIRFLLCLRFLASICFLDLRGSHQEGTSGCDGR